MCGPLIFVFDVRDPMRCRAMAKAFSEAVQGAFFFAEDRIEAMGSTPTLENRVNIALVHNTDRSAWERLNMAADVEIFYSGGNASDLAKPGEHWIRGRPISNLHHAVSVEEASEIVDFALDLIGGGTPTLPMILQPAEECEAVSALAILCQGYLAAHASLDANGVWGPAEIHPALVKMGWEDAVKGSAAALLRPEIAAQKDGVCQPGWWREPFLHLPGGFRRAIVSGWIRGEEAPLDGRVAALITAVMKKRKIRPSMVSELYLAICERLK